MGVMSWSAQEQGLQYDNQRRPSCTVLGMVMQLDPNALADLILGKPCADRKPQWITLTSMSGIYPRHVLASQGAEGEAIRPGVSGAPIVGTGKVSRRLGVSSIHLGSRTLEDINRFDDLSILEAFQTC